MAAMQVSVENVKLICYQVGGSDKIHVKARALYDFEGAAAGELTFNTDEILTILRQDIGEGWWEASNASGQKGLVPESYLEITSFKEPSIPPPPPPAVSHAQSWGMFPPQQQTNSTNQSWGVPASASVHSNMSARTTDSAQKSSGVKMRANEGADDWDDDDWDDDDESTVNDAHEGSEYGGPAGGGVSRGGDSRTGGGLSVRKPFNRFSAFTKTGGDAYLFESMNVVVPDSEKKAVIAETEDGYAWVQTDVPYQCSISSPKKESKFHGMKSFIAYQITPSFTSIQVSRRYKHFDWLQKRLVEKYTTIAIPPLPEKQIAGRFEDDFVNARLKQLQLWVDRMCKHPVVSQSEVFLHFITCTDEKKWTAGKRKSEKDEYVGGKFFLTVQAPPNSLDTKNADATLDKFGRFVRLMDDGLRQLYAVGENNVKKHQGPFKKEYQKIGNAFLTLATSFKYDTRQSAEGLTKAIEITGQAYNDIGQMFAAQPQNDMFHLLEGILEYKGIMSTFPDTLLVHKAAMSKVQESTGKVNDTELRNYQSRADVITYTILAEMENFQKHRTGDFKAFMQTFLSGQIEFYSQITRKLEETLRHFDNV